MTDSVTEPDLETTGSRELPGKRLREAREAAGLSIVDLAQQLHLAPNVIEALEADDGRMPWDDGLPAHVSAGLESYREDLDRTYCPVTNVFDMHDAR